MATKPKDSISLHLNFADGFAHGMVLKAYEGRNLNLSEVARAVGISPQRMHGYWKQEHSWPAEVWVRTMIASGRWEMNLCL